MGGGRDHAQIKIESREDVVARSLAARRGAVDFCIVNDTVARRPHSSALACRARKSRRGDDGERARRVGRVDAHLRAERRGARTRVENYNRHRERISRSTFARCEEESGYSEFDELGVRVSASSVAERALSAEVKTLED